MLVERLKKFIWFLRRPNYWAHARELAIRKVLPGHDNSDEAARARAWAADRAVPVADALVTIGLTDRSSFIPTFSAELLREGQHRAEKAPGQMGGPGDLNLLYAATVLSGARRVVETGVDYGWSSLAILAGLDGREGARLVSVDMPYPLMNNEPLVGTVVPERLRVSWELVREPDRRGLEKAIARIGGKIDLCHYDSDKSFRGRQYGFPLLWEALAPGGIFISDDIQDNMAFAEFVDVNRLRFAVTEYEGKFVGITRRA
jgi:predicted O-methyltransferase YrrM